ncbi:SpaA isopeptide-forming pilin-related protein [Corynebacterium pilosum]|nr:SpaA isopeptide-forming pilin-related protein [Corynebacterium pilosum]
MGLIVDTSGSMGKTGINTIKQILAGGSGKTGFIDEVGKTQTELGFVRFDDDSPAENNIVSPLSMNSDIDREKSKKWVGKLNSDNGGTNWEAGLRQFAEYNNANPALKYDVVFMITDGNPTRLDTKTKNDNGFDGEFRHVEAAMGMANTLKAQGTRVVPVGIPANWPRRASGTGETQLSVSDHNLQALSGMNSDGSSTSLRRSDFATFTDADVFRQALINTLNDCAITVERRFYEGDDPNAIPSRDNTRPTIEESRQWGFDGVLTPAGGQRTEQTKEYPTAEPDSDNLVARIGLNGTTNYSSIAVREETGKIPETWERMPAEGGQHAQCFRRNGDPVSVTNLDSRDQANPTNDFQLNNVPLAGGIHCVVYYRAKTIPTTYDLRLRKVDATDTTVSLDGAEFELRSLNDEGQPGDVLPTKSGDNTGEFVWDDLPLGSYVLTETRAAAGGYSLLPQPVYFKVEYDSDELAFFLLEGPNDRTGQRLDGASPSLNFPIVDFMVADQQVDLAIANVRAGELPKTGGAGVGLWIAAGILLIAAGAIGARRRAIA